MIYLLSSLTSATILVLLYFLLTFFLGKDVYWLFYLKLDKAIVVVVLGAILMVLIERWVEQVVPVFLEKQNVTISAHDDSHETLFGQAR